jgi:HK97 gp10 family phage protein
MQIKMNVTGLNDLVLKLRNTAERVSDTARKTMHRGADKIVKEAKLNCPVDEGNLEASIKKEVAYGERGRLEIDVAVGGTINGVNVDEYATEVHEHYEGMKPGPGTQAKREANPGRYVGEKFLTRAAETVRPRLEKDAISDVLKVWKL